MIGLGGISEMLKKNLKIKYEHIPEEKNQERLDEVFDLIFSKIEVRAFDREQVLDKSILEDYTIVSLS